jgi:hypothetical protein
VKLAERIEVFRRIPRGSTMTLVIRGQHADPLTGANRAEMRRERGTFRGIFDLHLGTPKIKFRLETPRGVQEHSVEFSLVDVWTIERVKLSGPLLPPRTTEETTPRRAYDVRDHVVDHTGRGVSMKEALKGIEADLRTLREDEKRIREEANAKIKRAEAVRDERLAEVERKCEPLEAAKAALRQQAGPTDEQRKQSVVKSARKRRAAKPKSKPESPGESATTNGHAVPELVAEEMEHHLRDHGNGGMTEKQLTAAVGLDRRGGHNTARAALRRLVEGGRFIEANSTSGDGTPLYTLASTEPIPA